MADSYDPHHPDGPDDPDDLPGPPTSGLWHHDTDSDEEDWRLDFRLVIKDWG